MRTFIRLSLLNSFSLFLVARLYPGLLVPEALSNLLILGAVFTLINRLVKPIIKLFLLPLNLVTLGLFSWVSNVLVLVIMTKIAPELQVVGFTSPSFTSSGFVIPELVIGLVLSYVTASALISLVFGLLQKFLVED